MLGREIFDALMHGSRLVYLFDEIDELILDREIQKTKERSVFSFLTPSFLTKLQDLRDSAKRREFIFVIGTNFLERIDPAAKRTGRIDERFLVLYPDLAARSGIIMEKAIQLAEKDLQDSEVPCEVENVSKLIMERFREKNLILHLTESTAFLQYLKLGEVVENAWTNRKSICDGLEKDSGKILELFEVGRNKRFQHEVELASYIRRPGAGNEFSSLCTLLMERFEFSTLEETRFGSKYDEIIAKTKKDYEKAVVSEGTGTKIAMEMEEFLAAFGSS